MQKDLKRQKFSEGMAKMREKHQQRKGRDTGIVKDDVVYDDVFFEGLRMLDEWAKSDDWSDCLTTKKS